MKLKKITALSGLLALSSILGYIENMLPLFSNLPGIKIGLANVIVLFVLYEYGVKEAFLVSLLRVFLVSLFYHGIFSIYFFISMVGAILSIASMSFLKCVTKWKLVYVSIVGSIFHVTGQVLVVYYFVGMSSLWNYYPILVLFSIPTGVLVGILSKSLLETYHKRFQNS